MVQGDSVPQEFIPKLVDLIMAGKFPIEQMIKFYDFADINLAAAGILGRHRDQAGAADAARLMT